MPDIAEQIRKISEAVEAQKEANRVSITDKQRVLFRWVKATKPESESILWEWLRAAEEIAPSEFRSVEQMAWLAEFQKGNQDEQGKHEKDAEAPQAAQDRPGDGAGAGGESLGTDGVGQPTPQGDISPTPPEQ